METEGKKEKMKACQKDTESTLKKQPVANAGEILATKYAILLDYNHKNKINMHEPMQKEISN